MKVKAVGLTLAIAMMLGMMIVPASAATGAGSHVGVFQGNASVGKGTATCNNDGTGSVSGGGIGLPIVHGLKTASWRIDAGTVVDVASGLGTAKLCGDLVATVLDTVSPAPLGASCVTTRGTNGKGLVDFASAPDIWVSNLGWELTAGGTFLVQGRVSGLKGKKAENLTAVVQALDELVAVGCVLKNKSTSQVFRVAAVYAIA